MRHEQLIEIADQRGRVTSENLDHEPETWELCLGVFKPNKDTNHETE